MGLVLVTPPAGKVVSTDEIRQWCRIDPDVTADDDLLDELVAAAADLVQEGWGLQLLSATWRLTGCSFADPLRLPRYPVSSVGSVTYADAAGDTQTLATSVWELDATGAAPVVRTKYGQVWPVTRSHPGSVAVTFTAGYGASADIPPTLKTAVKMAAHWWYERRGDERETAALALPAACVRLVAARWNGGY